MGGLVTNLTAGVAAREGVVAVDCNSAGFTCIPFSTSCTEGLGSMKAGSDNCDILGMGARYGAGECGRELLNEGEVRPERGASEGDVFPPLRLRGAGDL